MGQSDTSIQTVAEFITRGGWPSNLDRTTTQCERFNRSYIEEVRRTDINRVDIKSRDPAKVGRLLKSLARNVSTEVSMSTLAEEAGGPGASLSHDTIRDYLGALERLMVIEDQPAWSPHLRSKSILRTSPKRHFIDPSIAAAALGISHQKLVQDLKTMGFSFESMVIRDLRIYAQGLGGNVFHYRGNTGLEIDAIVELEDGSWAAFEVKLGDGACSHTTGWGASYNNHIAWALKVCTSAGVRSRRGSRQSSWVKSLTSLLC